MIKFLGKVIGIILTVLCGILIFAFYKVDILPMKYFAPISIVSSIVVLFLDF